MSLPNHCEALSEKATAGNPVPTDGQQAADDQSNKELTDDLNDHRLGSQNMCEHSGGREGPNVY
jgi:hypothetical protein